jgi:hypothetical protein
VIGADKDAKKAHDELLQRIDRVIYHGRKAGGPSSTIATSATAAESTALGATDRLSSMNATEPLSMERAMSIISAAHTAPGGPVHTALKLTQAQPDFVEKVNLKVIEINTLCTQFHFL